MQSGSFLVWDSSNARSRPILLCFLNTFDSEELRAISKFIIDVESIFFPLPLTTSRISCLVTPKELWAIQAYNPSSEGCTFFIFKYSSLVLKRGNFLVMTIPSGSLCHAVKVLFSGGSFVPENLQRNLTFRPSWTVYNGFTGARSTGGSDKQN